MRRPVVLTDPELLALLYVSNISREDEELWADEPKRIRAAHDRANTRLRAEALRRGWTANP